MILHKNEHRSLFIETIKKTSEEFNIPLSYVEKDYYLTNALLRISKSIYCNNVIFKGGTSLSKIYKAIDRFSEDIDLAILPHTNWKDAKIKKIIKEIIHLATIDLEDSGEKFNNGSRFRKKRYKYPRIDSSELLGEVKDTLLFECNAYTTPSPIIKRNIRSLIAEWAIESEQNHLINTYQLNHFPFLVLCWKRTFCEKILGLLTASSKGLLKDKVRHFYDLTQLNRVQEIKRFINCDNTFFDLLSISIENDMTHFEKEKLSWVTEDLSKNELFLNFSQIWDEIKSSYYGDFQKMIIYKENMPTKNEIEDSFMLIKSRLYSYSQSSSYLNLIAKP
ncbi:nucleotidyl transferase AbiEii/AbiGii toxin family protein [Proteus columbae]|uniref:nucleotidyl transferase AbiEii/AbiGii toxin family protein n=1 Tax=Proteus columbae TaxID=1987580 RepID=UPI00288AE0C0|nr:nucleotidyl transferase AbiEii/AbiGii toxin family protein [Proteus columbae]